MATSLRFARLIEDILSCRTFAVVGASRHKGKYGHRVYMALKGAGYQVFAVNPNADDIAGDPVYPLLDTVPQRPDCVVTVVPPEVTRDTLRQCGRLRIRYAWLQPGSESLACINEAQAHGIQAVHSGPCIMVALVTHRTRAPR